jgi:hypothetical protein
MVGIIASVATAICVRLNEEVPSRSGGVWLRAGQRCVLNLKAVWASQGFAALESEVPFLATVRKSARRLAFSSLWRFSTFRSMSPVSRLVAEKVLFAIVRGGGIFSSAPSALGSGNLSRLPDDASNGQYRVLY